eukprot:8880352-Pyramimonas_sp.AAC.1
MVIFVRELQMSLRALWHNNRKEIIRRAGLKYPDAWLGSVMGAEAEQLFILCNFPGDVLAFLE